MHFEIAQKDEYAAGLIARPSVQEVMRFAGLWEVECFRPNGQMRWSERIHNLVTNEGLNHILSIVLAAGTQDTTWFCGLLAASPTPLAAWVAADLAAVDFVAYDEATLPAFTPGAVSSQSVSNSASKAQFTISTNGSSIGGVFLIGTSTKATPAGTLYAAGAFSGGNKAADDNDVLQVTATFTAAAT